MNKLHKNNTRNLPCPCGSGKKHKRCCLRLSQEQNSKTVLKYGSELRTSQSLAEALAEKPVTLTTRCKTSNNTPSFTDEELLPKQAFFDIEELTQIKIAYDETHGNLIQANGNLFSVESSGIYGRLATTGTVVITDLPITGRGKAYSYIKVADKLEAFQRILFTEAAWFQTTASIPEANEGTMQDVFHKDAKSKRPLLSAHRLASGCYTNVHGQAFLTASDICTSVYDQLGGLILPKADFEDCIAVDVPSPVTDSSIRFKVN